MESVADRINRLKKEAEARKDADERAAEEERQRAELWRLEEAAMEARLRDDRPEEQLGVHYDFKRFGRYLVAVRMNTEAYRMYENKVAGIELKKNVQTVTAANEGFAKRSAIMVVDGDLWVTEEKDRNKMLSDIFAAFPSAADTLSLLLTELSKGGISARRGKSESS